MEIKKKHILIALLILLLTFILALSIALPLHFKNKANEKFNPETQIKSPVFLKAVYETLDSSADFEKEIKLGDFKVGTELKITHPEITAKLKGLVSENHEIKPDLAKSTQSLKVQSGTKKQYFLLYFRAKTYRVDFDFAENGIDLSSISDILKQPLNLKYTNKIPEEVKTALLVVKMQDSETDSFTLSHFALENGETLDFEKAYNTDLKIKPVFTKTALEAEYTVMHLLEKQGESSALDNTFEEIKEVKKDTVSKTVQYSEYSDLDKTKYEKDTTHTDNLLSAQLNKSGNPLVLKQYYRLKTTKVNFIGNGSVDITGPKSKLVKQTRAVEYPSVKPKIGYTFLGWSDSVSGAVQTKHVVGVTELNLYTQVEIQSRKITYIIKSQNQYGQYTISYQTQQQKIGETHTVSFDYNKTIYFDPIFTRTTFQVSADETENTVTITLKRLYFTVSFTVINSLVAPPARGVYYGAKVGAIDTDSLYKDRILKFYINNVEKTKDEVENYIVYKRVRIEIVVSVPKYLYPQTKVDLAQTDILREETKPQSFEFMSDGKTYKFNYTRTYVFRKNSADKYEKFNGKYFKLEEVEFIQIPGATGFYSKKIIDYTPFNIYKKDVKENSKYENSIFKGLFENISKIFGTTNLHPLTFDKNDKVFGVNDVARNEPEKLRKESTDYAAEILMSEIKQPKVFRYTALRAQDISSFKPADYDSERWMPYYAPGHLGSWWLATQQGDTDPKAYLVYRKNINNKMDWSYFPVYNVYGVVVGKK